MVIAEANFADDEADVGFPQNGIFGLKLLPEHGAETIDDFGRNVALTFLQLPFEALDGIVQRG